MFILFEGFSSLHLDLQRDGALASNLPLYPSTPPPSILNIHTFRALSSDVLSGHTSNYIVFFYYIFPFVQHYAADVVGVDSSCDMIEVAWEKKSQLERDIKVSLIYAKMSHRKV